MILLHLLIFYIILDQSYIQNFSSIFSNIFDKEFLIVLEVFFFAFTSLNENPNRRFLYLLDSSSLFKHSIHFVKAGQRQEMSILEFYVLHKSYRAETFIQIAIFNVNIYIYIAKYIYLFVSVFVERNFDFLRKFYKIIFLSHLFFFQTG